MTDSDIQTETWAPIPGFAIRYQASTEGQVRNKNGLVMSPRPDGGGYLQLNLVDDTGETRTRPVHKLILWTFCGECPEGMEACHGPGGQLDNRLVNLRWGPIPDNRREPSPRRAQRQPRTPAPCILCGKPVTKGGRRCHDCVVMMGTNAAEMMRSGETLEATNDLLEYGNAVYLHKLAVRYGRWGHCQPCSCAQDAPQMPADLVTTEKVTQRNILARLRRRFGKLSGDGR